MQNITADPSIQVSSPYIYIYIYMCVCVCVYVHNFSTSGVTPGRTDIQLHIHKKRI